MTVFPTDGMLEEEGEGMVASFFFSHHYPGTQPGIQLVFNKCYLDGWKGHKCMIAKINENISFWIKFQNFPRVLTC